jgi:DNA polymerase III subunit delta
MAAELKPVYLLSGSDRPKIARALHRLRERVGDAAETLYAGDASAADAVAACNARGLFAEGGRLVVVEEVENWKAADVDELAGYLAAPAPETVLALAGEGLKKDSKLAKACAKAGELLFYDVTRAKLPAWIADQFKRLGASADGEACRALVELIGEDLPQLEAEIEKLATWADGETIDRAAVELLASDPVETSAFALTDAWGRRDVGAALDACEIALERARGPRSSEIPRLVGRVAGHVALVRDCRRLSDEGRSAREAASVLKKNPYYVRRLFAQAGNFAPAELDDALVRLAALDAAVKGGSRQSGDFELELALIEITRPRERTAVSG